MKPALSTLDWNQEELFRSARWKDGLSSSWFNSDEGQNKQTMLSKLKFLTKKLIGMVIIIFFSTEADKQV